LRAGAASLVLLGVAGTAVSLTPGSATAATSAKVGVGTPKSAFTTHIGISATQVKIANISTHFETLFTGAAVGTQAYADYINAKGGVGGRKLVVTAQDTGYSGTKYAQMVQSDLSKDFALVGSFSVTATSGGQVLAKNPQMADVTVTSSITTNKLPNFASPFPLQGGWQEGPLVYFKDKYPSGVKKVGVLVADEPAATQAWQGEKATMEHLGYTIVYQNTYAITAKYNTFVADAVAMKSKGVQMLFIEQSPAAYAAPLIKAVNAQGFHPKVVLGASTYSSTLIPTSGGAAATQGAFLEQDISLYLGQDAKAIPAVSTFLHWVQVAHPGWKPDLFTFYGWVSAELFADALKNAGHTPSRGSLLAALGKITEFTGTGIQAPSNPSHKTVSNCYLLGQIKAGQWTRLTDPPVTSSTKGYRCTNSYYLPPSAG
jgi:ABC-type branched-subunit amino acid transport system substrate-binding protein